MYQILKKQKMRFFIMILVELIIITISFIFVNLYSHLLPFYKGNEMTYFISLPLILILANILYTLRIISLFDKKSRQNSIDTKTLLSADIKETYIFGEIGLVNYDEQGEIIWMSDIFTHRNIQAIGMQVEDWLPTLRVFFKKELNVETVKVELGGRIYSVLSVNDLKLLIFKDITDLENIYKTYHEQAIVFATIVIDNLDDISTSIEENELTEIESSVRKTITDWGKQFGMVLRRVKEDTYFAILQESSLRKVINTNFKIIDDVKRFKTSRNDNLTLSIGIGRSTTDIIKLAELSSNAVDVTLSRGGDQAVINNYGGRLEFYGGKSQSQEKSNTVKMRILSKTLSTHITSSKQVYVMGHSQADFDAIGACLGVVAMCQKAKVPCYIIWDDKSVESKARSAFRDLFSRQVINEMTISPQKAIEKNSDDTLLVVVDAHRPSIVMSQQVLAASKRVALIDHHRRSEEFIEDLLLTILEPSSSSTCELVAELIKFSPQGVHLSSDFATYMLTGILLDTNRYRVRTTARTYEASMILKEAGANLSMCDDFLKDEYEEYLVKNKIMNNITTPAYGVLVATSTEDEIVERSILAKIAQDALQIKGVSCVFVIGRIEENLIGISSRSTGAVNVQLLLEKLGGGGHYNSAAAQFKNTTIAAVNAELNNVIKLYLNEVMDT